MKQRFATEEADITNAARPKDFEGVTESRRVDPSKVGGRHFAARKVAEFAGCVTGVRHCDIAQRWTAAAN
jgi:hypothetical protein